MRTTIDLPDALYRKTKAVAALRGSSMKEIVIQAVEREVRSVIAATETKPGRIKRKPLPVIHLAPGQKLDLTGFDFDDLLG